MSKRNLEKRAYRGYEEFILKIQEDPTEPGTVHITDFHRRFTRNIKMCKELEELLKGTVGRCRYVYCRVNKKGFVTLRSDEYPPEHLCNW